MSYVVKASERIRASGADYETKAMLYLMNCRDDSHEIYCFAIDFFNDITGLNKSLDRAWDVQSKGAKKNSPKDIGKNLVTLFRNYTSDLSFDHLILFLGGVTSSLRVNRELTTFGIENIKLSAIKNIKDGLIEEGSNKEYIEKEALTNENIDAFLKVVTFVVDDKTKADYVRNIIKIQPQFIPDDTILESIFNQIRDTQSIKKNTEPVENELINDLYEVVTYDRILYAKDIRLMVLNRIINHDLVGDKYPIYFIPIVKKYDVLRQKEVIEDCQLKLSTVLFDKANTEQFWLLFDLITHTVSNNKSLTTLQTYRLIKDKEIMHNQRWDALAVQYLISVVKEALK